MLIVDRLILPVFVHSEEDVTKRPPGGEVVEEPDWKASEGRILSSSPEVIFL